MAGVQWFGRALSTIALLASMNVLLWLFVWWKGWSPVGPLIALNGFAAAMFVWNIVEGWTRRRSESQAAGNVRAAANCLQLLPRGCNVKRVARDVGIPEDSHQQLLARLEALPSAQKLQLSQLRETALKFEQQLQAFRSISHLADVGQGKCQQFLATRVGDNQHMIRRELPVVCEQLEAARSVIESQLLDIELALHRDVSAAIMGVPSRHRSYAESVRTLLNDARMAQRRTTILNAVAVVKRYLQW